MIQEVNPLAEMPMKKGTFVHVARLLATHTDLKPGPVLAAQPVAFDTSGHHGSSFEHFDGRHISTITHAIFDYCVGKVIDGPLFLRIGTHALPKPALNSKLEMRAANGVQTMIAEVGKFASTPVIWHVPLIYNRRRTSRLANGIVISRACNRSEFGGFKHDPLNGGPAGTGSKQWAQNPANGLVDGDRKDVKRIPLAGEYQILTTQVSNYLNIFVAVLGNAIHFDMIRNARLRLEVGSFGGAGLHYWARVAERYKLKLAVIGDDIYPQCTFIPVDWESMIGIDPSSYAMQRLIRFKDFCDIACDTDHDRHGIVTRNVGMLPAHHYLCVVADELFRNRSQWSRNSARGKNVFSSVLIDRALRPDHCKSKGPCERAWRRTPTNVRLALDGVAAVIAQTGRLAT